MGRNKSEPRGRVFVLELNSRDGVKNVDVPGGSQRIVIEGTLGTLRSAEFVDCEVLELVGSGGILRVDLSEKDLRKRRGGAP